MQTTGRLRRVTAAVGLAVALAVLVALFHRSWPPAVRGYALQVPGCDGGRVLTLWWQTRVSLKGIGEVYPEAFTGRAALVTIGPSGASASPLPEGLTPVTWAADGGMRIALGTRSQRGGSVQVVGGPAGPLQIRGLGGSDGPSSLAFGRDGAELCSLSDEGDGRACALALADLTTGGSRLLAHLPGRAQHVAWSPDGALIACLVGSPPGAKLVIVSSRTGTVVGPMRGGAWASMAWAPGGTRLALVSGDGVGLTVIDAPDGEPDVLPSTDCGGGDAVGLAWSPAGDVAYVSFTGGRGGVSGIAAFSRDGGRPHVIWTGDSPLVGGLAVSPDGRWVLASPRGVLTAVSTRDTTPPRVLVDAPHAAVEPVAWAQ